MKLLIAAILSLVFVSTAYAEQVTLEAPHLDNQQGPLIGIEWHEDLEAWYDPIADIYWKDGRWRTIDGLTWTPEYGWLDLRPHPQPQPRYVPPPATGDWLPLLSQYNWPVNEAYAVMMCESGGNANAVNPSGAVGLFQIHPYNAANFDPATNVARAYAKYLDGVSRGNPWWHWNQFGSCGWF